MLILAPINSLDEVEPLITAGVEEFYAGYVSPAWLKNYSLLASPNRRTFLDASFTDFEELKKTARLLKEKQKPLFITLNEAFYSAPQYALLLADVHKFLASGLNEFIVADLELLLLLQEAKLDVKIHLSTLAPALNANTVAFYQQFGVRRFTLPRCLAAEEIKSITASYPALEFDVFIFGGKCINIEGYCGFFHVNEKRCWPCAQEYTVLPETKASPEFIAAELAWQNLPRHLACGVCVLEELARSNIQGLKIVGRGAKLENKLQAVRFVKEGLELLAAGENLKKNMPRIYQGFFGQPCKPQLCYYPYDVNHG